MQLDQIAKTLKRLGCPPGQCADMASQLDKRARQLAKTKGRTYDEAMSHLLDLMWKGWAGGVKRK
ncbi:hypothetical protein EG831_12275 [bacterium]|nr:hypothetical protein [bacterium]